VINRLDVSALAGIRVYFPDGLARDLEVRVPGELPIVPLPTATARSSASPALDDPTIEAIAPTIEAILKSARDAAYEECVATSIAP
jgi:hypothetical protein